MPKPEMIWRHVVISTHGNWLPGDPRGVRSKDHDIHSSGDYKNPPPKGEHAGLFRHAKKLCPTAIVIPKHLREPGGRAVLAELQKCEFEVLALAAAGMHTHFLAELLEDRPETKAIVGRCKTAACYAIQEEMPGKVWARDGKYAPVNDREHQVNTYYYIERQSNAWIWTFRHPEGRYSD